MPYLVKKTIHGRPYYYLRKSQRTGQKVISKNIAYFGKIKPSKSQIQAKLAQISQSVVPKKQTHKKDVVPKENIYKQPENSKHMLTINDMAVFCKKKGFVYQNSEIYGGMAGFFDYGPLGVELKNNIKNDFWKTFVNNREDVVGIDGSIISSPKVWEASGHTKGFTDYLYTCQKCKLMAKGDNNKGIKCPKCNQELTNPSKFNLMFETNVGPTSEKNTAFLRPETAQLIFTNFKLVMDTARKKLPFGIAQTGRAFRNEISPRDFLFRTREFEQMEIEYFIHPKETKCKYLKDLNFKFNILTAELQNNNKDHIEMTIKEMLDNKLLGEWHVYWLKEIYKWFLDLGIKKENLRLREHLKDELAHYSNACFDIEYKFPFGWKEIHGSANRGQFDLQQHINTSKQNLTIYDEESKEKIIPRVIEPSQGVDRALLAFLFDAYVDDKERGNIVLKLHPKLVPVKVAIFPLVNKLDAEARKVYNELKTEFSCQYDRSGSIGRRYARADETAIPYCITIDFDTLKDSKVTIRDRNTTKQTRIKISNLKQIISKFLSTENTVH